MTIGVRVELGIRTGFADATSCKIVAASLTAGTVTVTGSWGSTSITMAAFGTAGYTGSATISGLSVFTKYAYSATQAGSGKSASGSFMTAPRVTDDFSLFYISCDCNTTFSDEVTGFWNKIHDYAVSGALPTAGLFFVDDHGYVDYCKVDDTPNTGKVILGGSGASYFGDANEYAIAYMCNLGMLGPATTSALLSNTAGTAEYINWGRDIDRSWCNKNLNYLPQWGDHEFINDFGFDYNKTTTTTIGGASATGVQIWAAGKAAWDAFMKPLAPTLLGASPGTQHYAWAMPMGCVNLIAPEGIFSANGNWNRTDAPGVATGAIGSIFGTAQIDDILAYVSANPQPFNLFGMSHSLRNMQVWNAGDALYNQGGQHPIYGHNLAEYQRLFTASDASGNPQKSVMNQEQSNGVSGVTVLLHGDYHHACVKYYTKPAYTNNLAENFYSVYLGTINGSANFTMPASAIAAGGYDDTALVYNSNWFNGNVPTNWAGMRVDVYGSKSKPELQIFLMDSAGNTTWSGKWYAKSSNKPVSTSHALPKSLGTSCKSAL